jgi:excisionase family DNA binding protein
MASKTHPAPVQQYISLQEAASALHVDTKTVRRLVARGILPAVKIGARKPGALKDTRLVRIPADALASILSPITTPAIDAGNPWGAK